MSKQVSANMLKPEADLHKEYVEIPVDVPGSDDIHIIKLYPSFSPEKIRDCVKEMAEFFNNCTKEKTTYKKEEEHDILLFFVVRHFTNLKMSKSKKSKKIYDDFKPVVNTELFRLLAKSFPQSSIDKVYDYAEQVIEATAKLENKLKSNQELIDTLPLENKDTLKNLRQEKTLQ